MIEPVTIERLSPAIDARGLVVEPLGPDDLPSQRNVHLVVTEPGCVRGNHYHERGVEVTLVIGPALFRYKLGEAVHDVDVPAGVAYRVTIQPGVPHAFRNTGEAPIVLVGFNTVAHDPARPDVVRAALI